MRNQFHPSLAVRLSHLALGAAALWVSSSALAEPQGFKDFLKPKAKKVADFGWTDGIHEKFKGKVVFSKTPILFKQGQESQLQREFTLSDEIYLMAYFERSFHNQVIQEGKQQHINEDVSAQGLVTLEVNGAPVGGMNNYTYHIQVPSDPFSKWTGVSYPDSPLTRITANSTRTLDRAFNAYVVPALKPGRNTVKMSVDFELIEGGKRTFAPAVPMAVGELIVNVKDSAELKGHLVKHAYLPKSLLSDPKLETDIKACLKDLDPVRVLFLNSDWEVVRDLGGIKKRSIAFTVVLKNGDTYKAQNHIAWQDYQGGGKYGRTQVTLAATHVMDVPSVLMK